MDYQSFDRLKARLKLVLRELRISYAAAASMMKLPSETVLKELYRNENSTKRLNPAHEKRIWKFIAEQEKELARRCEAIVARVLPPPLLRMVKDASAEKAQLYGEIIGAFPGLRSTMVHRRLRPFVLECFAEEGMMRFALHYPLSSSYDPGRRKVWRLYSAVGTMSSHGVLATLVGEVHGSLQHFLFVYPEIVHHRRYPPIVMMSGVEVHAHPFRGIQSSTFCAVKDETIVGPVLTGHAYWQNVSLWRSYTSPLLSSIDDDDKFPKELWPGKKHWNWSNRFLRNLNGGSGIRN